MTTGFPAAMDVAFEELGTVTASGALSESLEGENGNEQEAHKLSPGQNLGAT